MIRKATKWLRIALMINLALIGSMTTFAGCGTKTKYVESTNTQPKKILSETDLKVASKDASGKEVVGVYRTKVGDFVTGDPGKKPASVKDAIVRPPIELEQAPAVK